jgi:serine phosphatase RsbU (regulator of sigma subunit)
MLASIIEWDVAQRTLKGQDQCGDRYLVVSSERNVLMAVVDGLGHGDEAAAAAEIAINILEANPRADLITLFRRAHEALRQSRGAVMSIASLNGDDATLTWTGVGNVEGLLVRAWSDAKPEKESLLIRAGLLGASLPNLEPYTIPIVRGDTLLLTTDGIRGGFDEEINFRDSPKEIAHRILSRHSKGSDDALVLVSRCVGV